MEKHLFCFHLEGQDKFKKATESSWNEFEKSLVIARSLASYSHKLRETVVPLGFTEASRASAINARLLMVILNHTIS